MTDKNELMIVGEDHGLPKIRTKEFFEAFAKSSEQSTALLNSIKKEDVTVTSVDQTEKIQNARDKRLSLRNIRIEVEKTRVALKAQSLREVQTIDAMAKILKNHIKPTEEFLAQQEKFVELQEKAKLDALVAKRKATLSKYMEDVSAYNFENMSDEAFDSLLETAKVAHQVKLDDAKKIEEARIAKEKADAEENLRIRKENERLKLEAEKKEKEDAIAREKAEKEEAIAKEKSEKEAQEKARVEAEEKAKQDAILEAQRKKTEEAEAKLKAEREAVRKAEEAKKAKEEAERKVKEDAERTALLAPDKEKLSTLADKLDDFQYPNVASRVAGNIVDEAEAKVSVVVEYIRERAKGL